MYRYNGALITQLIRLPRTACAAGVVAYKAPRARHFFTDCFICWYDRSAGEANHLTVSIKSTSASLNIIEFSASWRGLIGPRQKSHIEAME
ncbi:hypothetical protein Cob_v009834 [Colletotrichum orbiculare MAFF 240422]|uniref:Uncharacterized protein n=1 Tax=Colletotrichum orbiculare (strain 104-T / ATCC 96160 / CBS 514.97 / LARS 414 / MAFF 240422) TaxID=1213857 RepID=A0A484FJU4_COLOR|nr:hypothetical protein Cob_v009834 [Colletotrichum orbiculare MAFF 240422]